MTQNDFRAVEPETRSAIEALINEAMWRLDHGRADLLWELYAEDGFSDGPMGRMEGRESIRAWGMKRAQMPQQSIGRHHINGIRLVWEGAELTGCVQYATHRDSTDNPLVPASIGEFHEVYRQEDGVWKYASRKIVPIFGGGNAAAHAQRVTQNDPA